MQKDTLIDFDKFSLSKILTLTLSFISLATVLILTSGYLFDLGWLSAFSLDGDEFPRSTSEIFHKAFYSSAILYLKISSYKWIIFGYFMALPVLSGLIGGIVILAYRKGWLMKLKPKVDFIEDTTEGSIIKDIFKLFIKSFSGFLFFLFVISAPIVLGGSAYIAGRDLALKEIEIFKENNFQCYDSKEWSRCTTIYDTQTDQEVFTGYLIASSSHFFAVLDEDMVKVMPRNNQLEIRRRHKLLPVYTD